jgi:transcriptional regulator with XRE-family HTH domain
MNLEQKLKPMTNNEKFKSLISKEKTATVSRNKERIKNRARLRESQDIALKVLTKLDDLGWSQRRLAKELNVSAQQVNKIVKGKENLTLETQVKLQQALDIPILASYYENKIEEFSFEDFFNFEVSKSKQIINQGSSFFKKEFKEVFNSNPEPIFESESNYQLAS